MTKGQLTLVLQKLWGGENPESVEEIAKKAKILAHSWKKNKQKKELYEAISAVAHFIDTIECDNCGKSGVKLNGFYCDDCIDEATERESQYPQQSLFVEEGTG